MSSDNSARKDEIAKQHAQRWWLSMDSSPDPETPESLIEAFKQALTSYEEEPASAVPDENGSVRCPNGHGFVYRSPEDASLQCMRCERDHFAEQLGLVYDHVTNGLLSKPYDLRGVKSTIDDCITEQVNEAVKEELEARTPSGEGWQHRIAAIDHPWEFYGAYDEQRCFFCGKDKDSCEHEDGAHDADCLWQNAKDATPPASPAKDTRDDA